MYFRWLYSWTLEITNTTIVHATYSSLVNKVTSSSRKQRLAIQTLNILVRSFVRLWKGCKQISSECTLEVYTINFRLPDRLMEKIRGLGTYQSWIHPLMNRLLIVSTEHTAGLLAYKQLLSKRHLCLSSKKRISATWNVLCSREQNTKCGTYESFEMRGRRYWISATNLASPL